MLEVKDQYIYSFSQENEPVMHVASGETLRFHTKDCFCNQITSEEQKVETIDWDVINPATGPVFVEGAKPGDILKVKIEKMELGEYGVMVAISGDGVLGNDFTENKVKIIKVSGDVAEYNEEIQIPCTPMIGVIGVAPAGAAIPCGEPGNHGGNMDNTKIGEGATLYLPVSVEGALLAMGDVHANMGDGEIMVSGIEIPAVVQVSVEVLEGKELRTPFLETQDALYSIASDKDLEQAIYIATSEMCKHIQEKKNYSIQDAGMLMSAVGNLEICQVVDPKRTVRFKMEKKYLK